MGVGKKREQDEILEGAHTFAGDVSTVKVTKELSEGSIVPRAERRAMGASTPPASPPRHLPPFHDTFAFAPSYGALANEAARGARRALHSYPFVMQYSHSTCFSFSFLPRQLGFRGFRV